MTGANTVPSLDYRLSSKMFRSGGTIFLTVLHLVRGITFRVLFLCYATALHFPFCFPMSFLHIHVFIVIPFRLNFQIIKMFLILLT